MRTAAMTMAVCAALLAACGGDREQTGSAAGRTDTTTPRADTAAAGKAEQPAAAATPVSGQSVYGRTCVTCHQATGRGMPNAFPSLAGSSYATGDKATLIKMVLNGVSGPWTTASGQRFNGIMPPWKGQLNDADVAAVLTYVRSSFGNSASAVTADEVRQQRAATASKSTPYTQAELRGSP